MPELRIPDFYEAPANQRAFGSLLATRACSAAVEPLLKGLGPAAARREDEVRAQLARPAFRRVRDLGVRFLPYGELERHRESMARFGGGLKTVRAFSEASV